MHQMTDRELIELKIELEFGIAPSGGVLQPATKGAADQPRLLVSHYREGYRIYVRHDVPHHVRTELSAQPFERLRDDEQAVKDSLARHAPCRHVWRVCWYTFERAPS